MINKKLNIMKTIYAVTSGEYSDYGIDSLFDSQELAQSYIDSFNADEYDKMKIEEFKLNPFEKQIKKGCLPYFLRMTKEGECTEIEITSSSHGFGDEPRFDIEKNIYHHVFAKDEKHAVKILNEIRVQYIAMNKWGN
jgi:hypothetical protein